MGVCFADVLEVSFDGMNCVWLGLAWLFGLSGFAGWCECVFNLCLFFVW